MSVSKKFRTRVDAAFESADQSRFSMKPTITVGSARSLCPINCPNFAQSTSYTTPFTPSANLLPRFFQSIPVKKAELIYEKDKEAAEKQFRVEAAKHFEKAFGKGSCWKVFGTHYPSSTGYAEFIKQITVLIKKWNVVDQGNEILKDFHGYR